MLQQKIKELIAHINEHRYQESMMLLMFWDRAVTLPPKGQAYRQKMFGYFMGKAAELMRMPSTTKLAAYFSDVDLDNVEDDIHRGLIRYFLYMYDRFTKVPAENQIRLAELTEKGLNVWEQAHHDNDFDSFEPVLQQIIDLTVENASAVCNKTHPLETMMNQWDEQIKLEHVTKMFDELKLEIRTLLAKVNTSNINVADDFLRKDFDKEPLHQFVVELTQSIGYDKDCSVYGEALHPFTASVGPHDSRITVNYKNYEAAVFAGIHEAGHAMYGLGSNDEVIKHGLFGGVSGSIHEGQARFFENVIGRGKAFWEHFYSNAQTRFSQFEGVDLEAYYKAINKVQPSLIRIHADELTYSLHPVIRFEIEKEMFEGNIKAKDLPKVWSEKYNEYLGITPSNNREGVLQDIHWSNGQFGYFQSYTLGNIYSGQLRAKLLADIPDLFNSIAAGDFAPLNKWIRDKVYQYGRIYKPSDLIKKAFGEELNIKYFVEYLNSKYSDMYEL